MNLNYSQKAENARALFFNKPIIYVEGQDDLPFWTTFFHQAGFPCKIEAVGGSKIKDTIARLDTEKSTFFVAMDRDYSCYTNEIPPRDNLIMTPCHSIENIIFCRCKINDFVRKRAYLYDDEEKKLDDKIFSHMKKFKRKFFLFLYFDILNQVYSKGKVILKKNYNNLDYTDRMQLKEIFSREELQSLAGILKHLYKNFFLEVRGHFLESWACDLVRILVKNRNIKINCDNNTLRAAFNDCSCSKKCELYTILIQEITQKMTNSTIEKHISRQRLLNL